jgi:thiamine monophosphate kinase
VAAALNQDPAVFAARGGEDYELCFCASPGGRSAIELAVAAASPETPVTWIGEVGAGPVGARFRDLPSADTGLAGYEHSF